MPSHASGEWNHCEQHSKGILSKVSGSIVKGRKIEHASLSLGLRKDDLVNSRVT